MKLNKIAKYLIIGPLALLTFGVQAEAIDGTKILEQEASRARELQKLEYQAKLLEQRARVAQAYQNLKQSGGVVPGDFTGAYGVQSPEASGQAPTETMSSLMPEPTVATFVPKLKKMMGRNAMFETPQGQVMASVGMLLPGGYKLLSLNLASGAKLEKDGMIYLSSIGW